MAILANKWKAMYDTSFDSLQKLNINGFCIEKKKIACNKDYHSYKKPLPINRSFPFYLDDNTFHCKTSYDDRLIVDSNSNDINVHSGHRMFDFHGYTTIGAEHALRRILTSVDRSRQQVIKINVGQGSHSVDKKARLPDVVLKVSKDLGLPSPIKHEKNPGYLLMILPPVIPAE